MDSVRVIDIECPFLGTFFEYNENLEFTNYNRYWQKRKGFLTSRTAKVVLGDDEETRRVRKRAIEAENQNVFAPYVFVPGDKPPTPIGGLRRIQEKLVYPEFAIRRKIEGTTVVACLVDEEGQVRDTRVLRSLHPILDLIAMQAIKSVKWMPATSWSDPIATRILVAARYKLENFLGQRLDMTFPWPYQIFQKEFVIHEVKENYLFYEEGFETESATRIQYLSDDFFALLVEHPDLIEYPYYLFNQGNIAGGIGLTVDAENFEFVYIEINHEK